MISLFFGVFFFFNDAFATVIWEDNFDSYENNTSLDYLGQYHTYSSAYTSSNYYNSPYQSVHLQYGMGDSRIVMTFPGTVGAYLEASVYFTGGTSALGFYFGTDISHNTYLGRYMFDSTSGAKIVSMVGSGLNSSYVLDSNTSCSSNAFCQGWHKIGFHLHEVTGDYSAVIDYYMDDVYLFSSYLYAGDYSQLSSGIYEFNISNQYTIDTYIDDLYLATELPSSTVDGVCGSVDGTTFNYADFDLQEFCSSGYFFTITGEVDGWYPYSCQGINGGTTDYCEANYYVNGDCGSVAGTSVESLTVDSSNLCYEEYADLLDESSFSSTATGWSWICNGLYGGYDSFCTADKSDVVFPDVPELEDCSSYTFPNNWICSINNTLKSAFFPSADKLNELNLTINEIQQKAPFNYLNLAKTKITDLTNNITQEGLSISILGNTSTINENALTTLANNVKKFFTFLLMLAFLFWGINYIKHFFK